MASFYSREAVFYEKRRPKSITTVPTRRTPYADHLKRLTANGILTCPSFPRKSNGFRGILAFRSNSANPVIIAPPPIKIQNAVRSAIGHDHTHEWIRR
jgi:hypothetical protein